jgi:hypothetical protein
MGEIQGERRVNNDNQENTHADLLSCLRLKHSAFRDRFDDVQTDPLILDGLLYIILVPDLFCNIEPCLLPDLLSLKNEKIPKHDGALA